MTPCAELTTPPISIYSFGLPFSWSLLLHYPTNNQALDSRNAPAPTYNQQQQLLQSTSSNQPTTLTYQLLSPRATLRSSAISNASAYFCQPRSLPAINNPLNTSDDYYSRHHSQCLPPASLLAPALPRPGLFHLFPNESIALAITQTAKPCLPRTITHTRPNHDYGFSYQPPRRSIADLQIWRSHV